jgi:mono/diheme cytochrome c family protein
VFETRGSVLRVPLALTGYELGLLIVALSFIAFALIVALVIPRSRPTFPGKRLPIFIGVCIALFAAQMTAVLLLAEVGEADEPVVEGGPAEPKPKPPPPPGTPPAAPPPAEPGPPPAAEPPPASGAQGDPVAGREIFVTTAACGSCHTLADAGTSGTIGPDLDALKPPYDVVVTQVTNGGGGMPPFKDTLSEQQIKDVAAYVSQSAGS